MTAKTQVSGSRLNGQDTNNNAASTRQHPVNVGKWERVASMVAGAIGLFLLSRRLFLYLGLGLASGYLFYRGLTGYCLVYEQAGISTLDAGEVEADTGRPRTEQVERWMQDERESDPVLESSMQSFPASDPPSF